MSQDGMSFEEFEYHKADWLRERYFIEMYENPPAWLTKLAEEALKEGKVLDDDGWTRFFDGWVKSIAGEPEEEVNWVEFVEEQYEAHCDQGDTLYEDYKEMGLL